MVKTPKMRHSKSSREPLTIDLEAASTPRADEAQTVVTTDEAPNSEPPAFVEPVERTAEQPASPREEADEYTAASRDAASDDITGDTANDRASASASEPFASEPAAARAMPQSGRSGRDGFSRILAGAIGAAIALVVAGGLQYAGVLGGSDAPQADPTIQAQIDVLKQQVSALQAAPQADASGRLDAISGEIEAVKADVAALKGAGSGADPAIAQGLEDRLKALETALSGLAQAGGGQAPADVSDLGGKIVALEAGTKAATDSAAAASAKIAALEQTLAALSAKVDSQASQPQVALAIASAALRSALDRGAPFTAELDTLASLTTDAASISSLRPYAEQGVASLAALKADAESSAAAIIAAADPPDENAGFFSRLLHSAGSLVTVRPIGSVDGTDAASILARMEAAISDGRLDAAVAEYNSLPPASQAASASFGERLKARQAADQLVAQAIAAATKA